MDKYEYKCVCILGGGKRTTEKLNDFGKNGWELITVVFIWHYFKRKLN